MEPRLWFGGAACVDGIADGVHCCLDTFFRRHLCGRQGSISSALTWLSVSGSTQSGRATMRTVDGRTRSTSTKGRRPSHDFEGTCCRAPDREVTGRPYGDGLAMFPSTTGNFDRIPYVWLTKPEFSNACATEICRNSDQPNRSSLHMYYNACSGERSGILSSTSWL